MYAQIASQVRVAVASGELGNGEPLPSVRTLASRLRVNRCLKALCLLTVLASCIRTDSRMHSPVDPKFSGRFFNREDIRLSGRSSLADLLRTVPGAAVTHRSDGGVQVLFARCRGKMPPRARGAQVETGTQLFINGMKVQNAAAELGALRLSDLEAIEVYRGPSELPADARGDGCAAIFVRTGVTR